MFSLLFIEKWIFLVVVRRVEYVEGEDSLSGTDIIVLAFDREFIEIVDFEQNGKVSNFIYYLLTNILYCFVYKIRKN